MRSSNPEILISLLSQKFWPAPQSSSIIFTCLHSSISKIWCPSFSCWGNPTLCNHVNLPLPILTSYDKAKNIPFLIPSFGELLKHRKSHHRPLYRELALTDMQRIHRETVLSWVDHPLTDQVVIWWLIIGHLIRVHSILTQTLYMTITWLLGSTNAVVSFVFVLLLDLDARCLSNPGWVDLASNLR